MWERTLTVGSAGKTFSVTGWKCGWMYGPDYLIRNSVIAHQNNIYCYCTPVQVRNGTLSYNFFNESVYLFFCPSRVNWEITIDFDIHKSRKTHKKRESLK